MMGAIIRVEAILDPEPRGQSQDFSVPAIPPARAHCGDGFVQSIHCDLECVFHVHTPSIARGVPS